MVETSSVMNKITYDIQKIKNRIVNQSVSITKNNAAMAQITDNIDKLKRYVEKQASSVSLSFLQEIPLDSEELLQINKVIRGIAAHINLLSMSAAIVTAHALNTGNEFAVVADEIRALAVSSGEQAKTIGFTLKEIKSVIDKSNEITGNKVLEFKPIDSPENRNLDYLLQEISLLKVA